MPENSTLKPMQTTSDLFARMRAQCVDALSSCIGGVHKRCQPDFETKISETYYERLMRSRVKLYLGADRFDRIKALEVELHSRQPGLFLDASKCVEDFIGGGGKDEAATKLKSELAQKLYRELRINEVFEGLDLYFQGSTPLVERFSAQMVDHFGVIVDMQVAQILEACLEKALLDISGGKKADKITMSLPEFIRNMPLSPKVFDDFWSEKNWAVVSDMEFARHGSTRAYVEDFLYPIQQNVKEHSKAVHADFAKFMGKHGLSESLIAIQNEASRLLDLSHHVMRNVTVDLIGTFTKSNWSGRAGKVGLMAAGGVLMSDGTRGALNAFEVKEDAEEYKYVHRNWMETGLRAIEAAAGLGVAYFGATTRFGR